MVSIDRNLAFVLAAMLGTLFGTPATRAQQGPVVALFDIEDKGSGVPLDELSKMTDLLGARLAEGGYRMIPREEVKKRLADQKKDSYRLCYDRSCQIELGRELAAQKSLAVRILAIGQGCQVIAELYDLEQATTELAATEECYCNINSLVGSLGRVARKLCRPLKKSFQKQSRVYNRTPPPPVPVSRSAPVPELKIEDKPDKSYSYLGLDDALVMANLFVMGMDPSDAGYFVFHVMEGVSFFQFHPILDIGLSMDSFAYRYDQGTTRWSLFGLGPAFRVGRLIVKSKMGMLSFKGGSWAPSFSLRATIPLVTGREVDFPAGFIPLPTVGLDIHFTDSFGYENARVWVGFEWIGDVVFD